MSAGPEQGWAESCGGDRRGTFGGKCDGFRQAQEWRDFGAAGENRTLDRPLTRRVLCL